MPLFSNRKEWNVFYKYKREWSLAIFALYIGVLCYFLFFSEMFGRTEMQREYHYNLVLFREIKRFWIYRRQLGIMACVINIIGNVAAFLPYGFFLPILSEKFRHTFKVFLLSFSLSLTVELMQLIFKVGCFDVDDLLLNTIGGVIGYGIYKLSRRKFR